MRVLISNPCLHPKSVWPPYLWARFKTYIELDYEKEVDVEWLPSLYVHDPILPDEDFDIFVISQYVWNYEKNYELARQAKERNPNVFVIAGGPQVPYNNNNVFEETVIDALCYAEGERVFAEFLHAWQNGNSLDIDGIILKTNQDKPRTTVPKLALNNLHSPYIHCEKELEKVAKDIKAQGWRLNVMWESNRGCPYGCTFCDWGHATNSKVKQFNIENAMREIEIIMSWAPEVFFITDANWGMFDSDLKYIDKLCEMKKKVECKTSVAFSAAKNKKTIVNESYRRLAEAGLMSGGMQIGFQHLDPEVLKTIKRDNIKTSKSLEEMTETYELGLPVLGVLILGNPGDTLDKWRFSVCELLRMQFHEDLKTHDFMLLPNAPAADPAYMEEHGIGYIEKYYNEKPGNRGLYLAKFISHCNTFNKDDWIEMQIWSYLIQAGHSLGITKFLSLFAYHAMNISYEDFYDHLASRPIMKEILNECRDLLHDYVYGDRPDKFIIYQKQKLNLDNFIYVKMLDRLDDIFDSLDLGFGEYTESLYAFQKFISVTYDNTKTILDTPYNYKSWFNSALKLAPYKQLETYPVKESTVHVNDLRTGYLGERDSCKVNCAEGVLNTLDKAPNYRHQIAYYPKVLEC